MATSLNIKYTERKNVLTAEISTLDGRKSQIMNQMNALQAELGNLERESILAQGRKLEIEEQEKAVK